MSSFVIVPMHIDFMVGKAAEANRYPNIQSSSAEVNNGCKVTPAISSFSEMLPAPTYSQIPLECLSWVGTPTGCTLDGRGLIPGGNKIIFSTPKRPDRLWDPPSLLADGHGELFPRG
jgi:hypothetical protein